MTGAREMYDRLRLAADYYRIDCGCEMGTVDDAFVYRPCSLLCRWYAYFTAQAREAGKPSMTMVDNGGPCPCLPMPRNYWHHPVTGWEPEGRPVRSGAGADNDAALYNAGRWDAWVIRCPACGMVYAQGSGRVGP